MARRIIRQHRAVSLPPEELVSEGVLAILELRLSGRVDATRKPEAFEATTAYFTMIKASYRLRGMRRLQGEQRSDSEALRHEPADDSPTTEEILSAAQLNAAIRDAVNALPNRQRKMVTMVYAHEMTMKAAGEEMFIGPRSAGHHLSCAKQQLSATLAEHWRAR